MDQIEIPESQLQKQLDLELFRRMPPAALAFFIFGVCVNFLELKNFDEIYLKIIGAIIMVTNLWRWKESRKSYSSLTPSSLRLIYFLVYLNTTCFALVYALLSFDIGFHDPGVLAHLLMMVGMIAASPFTLSYSRSLFLYFILATLIPQAGIVWLSGLAPQYKWTYLISFLVIGLYSMKQGFSYRKEFLEKSINELRLKKAYEELSESRKQVIEQTLMTEHANRLSALGEMAGGVAHEINNPLAVILGNIQYIERNYGNLEMKEKIFSAMKKAQASVGRIDRIIKSLKSLTRQSYQAPLEESLLANILQETLSLCEEKFRSKGIQIIVDVPDDLKAHCQPVQISQILINLLNNSYDVVELLDIDSRYIKIDAFARGDQVHMKVSNPGEEIEKSIQDKLFQPFFTTKDVGKGTGLGLSISRSMALQNNGNLFYVYDASAKENQFCISLPSGRSKKHEVA